MGALTFFFSALPHTSPFLTVIYIFIGRLIEINWKNSFPLRKMRKTYLRIILLEFISLPAIKREGKLLLHTNFMLTKMMYCS